VARAELAIQSPFERALHDSQQAVRESAASLALIGEPASDATEQIRRLRLEYEHTPASMIPVIAANDRLAASQRASASALRDTFLDLTEAQMRRRGVFQNPLDVGEDVARIRLQAGGSSPEEAARIAGFQRTTIEINKVTDILQNRVPLAFERMANAAITGSESMSTAVIGSFAEIARALPGVSPLEGSLIGFVGSLLGNIFSHHDRSVRIDSYSQQALDQMRRANPEQATARVIVIDSRGHTIEELLYEAGRREDRDAIDRIPDVGR
jgi:hypothetical protein